MCDKFVGFACLHHMVCVQIVCVQYLLNSTLKKKKKYHATKNEAQATGCWCSLPCSILLKYLHPKQKIEQVIPIKGHEHKQQLQDCVVVS